SARKRRVGEHLLQIVNEMRAADLGDAGDLVLPCVLEIDAIGRNAVTGGPKESALRHPCPRGIAQVDAIRIVVAKFGFVTDDDHRHVVLPAAPEKSVDTLNHFRLPKTFSINLSLQLLPRQFALGKQPDRVTDRLLSAGEIRADEAPLPCGSEKQGI